MGRGSIGRGRTGIAGQGALVAALALVATIAFASSASAAPRDPRLAGVGDFAFALGLDADEPEVQASLTGYDLVVVDGEETSAASVAALRAGGAIVLGYLSVGTIEPYRPWYKRLKRYRLPDRFEEFDEDYARVRAPGFRRAIAGRIAPQLLGRGFDGLFLDNVDMVEEHPKQRGGMRKLVRRLSGLVHAAGGFLFAQNGEDSITPLLPILDGWNREDVTWTYSFKKRRYVHQSADEVAEAQAALATIAAAGLLVTSADYTAAGDLAAEEEARANACAVGAIPFVSNIGLTRVPHPRGCGA